MISEVIDLMRAVSGASGVGMGAGRARDGAGRDASCATSWPPSSCFHPVGLPSL